MCASKDLKVQAVPKQWELGLAACEALLSFNFCFSSSDS